MLKDTGEGGGGGEKYMLPGSINAILFTDYLKQRTNGI